MSLYIPNPPFESSLTQLVFQLERLRYYSLKGTTPKWLFFDLKEIMQMLESLTSARIEGNRTTVMGVVEAVIQHAHPTPDEQIKEIANIQKAIDFIEASMPSEIEERRAFVIDEKFINTLHRISVDDLTREGSATPGRFRTEQVQIRQSNHIPPAAGLISNMMKDVVEFINEDDMPQQDLLKTAIAHHRMAWIHPYDNGNGRVTRLVTYAMLAKQGFIDDKGFHILNPTAIFCIDRTKYYDMLAYADSSSEEALTEWCEYVLDGIRTELKKVDRLLDVNFAKSEIIKPALELARAKEWLSLTEYEIMLIAIDKGLIQAGDIIHIFGKTASGRVQASRVISRLKEQGYLASHPDNPRKYFPRFYNNYLLRGVMQQLEKHDLLPVRDEENI
jgi:Fic family protein